MEFEEFEKKSLLLDILIDCEEYKDFDNRTRNDICIGQKQLEKPEFTLKIQEAIKTIQKTDPIDRDGYFKIILYSKYLRRLIREIDKDVEPRVVKAHYKQITEELLKRMPPKNDQESTDENWQNKLRVIFHNEISAANESNLAIGYAEVALDELGELDKKWNLKNGGERIRHPYELYALYNKGLALLHDHTNIEGAIDTLSQITDQFEPFGKFKKEYNLEEDYLYAIFFWLIYIPTMYLLAEASNDLYSSSGLETNIKKALKRINNEIERVSLDHYAVLTKNIANYYRVKFNTQFIISLIDSGRFDKKDFSTKKWGWLQIFKKYFGDDNEFTDFIANCRHKCESNTAIGNQMDAAEALFYLEYARRDKKRRKDYLSISFGKCFPHIKRDFGSDWSDFANTFLEGVVVALENYEGDTKPFLENLKLPGISDPQQFENCYRTIFHRINEEEWIARKKELVENFLICQEKHLGQYAAYYRKGNPNLGQDNDLQIRRDKLLRYQIELIENILGKESERRFKKKWPECEKEKLAKNLITTLKSFGYKNILAWWHVAEANLAKEIECTQDFEKIVEDMQNILCNKTYSLPENDALDGLSLIHI